MVRPATKIPNSLCFTIYFAFLFTSNNICEGSKRSITMGNQLIPMGSDMSPKGSDSANIPPNPNTELITTTASPPPPPPPPHPGTSNTIDLTPIKPPDCCALQLTGLNQSGVYTIHPFPDTPDQLVEVYCDFESVGGGYTVISRRQPQGSNVNFNASWDSYVQGFGITASAYWLGFKWIVGIDEYSPSGSSLLVNLTDWDGLETYAKYDYFHVDKNQDYQLNVSGYEGNAGNPFSGLEFMTFDRSTDYKDPFAGEVVSLQFSELKIRPRNYPNGCKF